MIQSAPVNTNRSATPARNGSTTSKKRLAPSIILKLTAPELELLTSLASDQLFRKEFIDPKMPGHKPNPGEISLGKALVSRLKILLNPGSAIKQTSR